MEATQNQEWRPVRAGEGPRALALEMQDGTRYVYPVETNGKDFRVWNEAGMREVMKMGAMPAGSSM